MQAIRSVEWDEGNWPNCGVHGVSQAEIEWVLNHDPRILPDRRQHPNEDRYNAIGPNGSGRYVFVVFTIRVRLNVPRFDPFLLGTCTPRRSVAMAEKQGLKPFPSFKTDEEAEEFVATADLSEYDLSGFRLMSEFVLENGRLKHVGDVASPTQRERKKAR
jgi:uncharacterized protein